MTSLQLLIIIIIRSDSHSDKVSTNRLEGIIFQLRQFI